MADGVLGLGSAGSQGLNADLIAQLKEAERESTVKPLEDQLEDWDIEVEQFAEIETKINELLEISKKFDLFNLDGNVFDQVFATTSGTSASFDATDTSNIKDGTTTVNITQLAQKSVHSSAIISDPKEVLGEGTISITIDGKTTTIETKDKTYEQVVDELNNISKLDVSLEQVGEGEYRMIVKGSESGLKNDITITGTGVFGNTGTDDDGNPIPFFDKIQSAQNLKATVDGIEYNLASNTIMLQNGLTITALEEGTSSISIQKDTAAFQTAVQEMFDVYNELVNIVNEFTLSAESEIEDKSTLKTIMQGVKDIILGDSYGDGNKSLFEYGIILDSTGYLGFDPEGGAQKFSEAVTNDLEGLQSVFVGTADNEGIGTRLKSYMDEIKGFNGYLSTMGDNMLTRKETLEEEKEKAITLLDNKYEQMTAEFAAYTAIITQFENSFSGLQMIIAQSTASS